MDKYKITDLDLNKKRALMRVDFNVPLDSRGNITNDTRIKAALPSIMYVLDQGGSLVLMSHLGRPKGKVCEEFSLGPCAKRLSELLNRPVLMAPDCISDRTQEMVDKLQPGEVLLLENLRFNKGEEKPDTDPGFAEKLAKLGEVYINDAFGTAHRAHASTVHVANHFPGRAASGFLLQKELDHLDPLLLNPKRPYIAILGGAKVSSKIGVIEALLDSVDVLIIVGAMAFTFLKAKGASIGNSLFEEDYLETAKAVMNKEKDIILPIDCVIAKELSEETESQIVSCLGTGIPDGWVGVDIGPKTIANIEEVLKGVGSVFWNGPAGVFEILKFCVGTRAIAGALSRTNATTIVGGGDSIAAIQSLGLGDKMTHLSTGGGASLEYLEKKSLPGIEALSP